MGDIVLGIIVISIVVSGGSIILSTIFRIDGNLKKLTANKQATATPPQTPAATQTDAASQVPAPTLPDTSTTPPAANANSPEANTNSPDTNSAPPAESALDALSCPMGEKVQVSLSRSIPRIPLRHAVKKSQRRLLAPRHYTPE